MARFRGLLSDMGSRPSLQHELDRASITMGTTSPEMFGGQRRSSRTTIPAPIASSRLRPAATIAEHARAASIPYRSCTSALMTVGPLRSLPLCCASTGSGLAAVKMALRNCDRRRHEIPQSASDLAWRHGARWYWPDHHRTYCESCYVSGMTASIGRCRSPRLAAAATIQPHGWITLTTG